jgi:hypothetical protein
MSAYARIVTSDVYVIWDPGSNGTINKLFVRRGTLVDVVPGSQLEAGYGSANLSAVLPPWDPRRGNGPCLSRAAQANLPGGGPREPCHRDRRVHHPGRDRVPGADRPEGRLHRGDGGHARPGRHQRRLHQGGQHHVRHGWA